MEKGEISEVYRHPPYVEVPAKASPRYHLGAFKKAVRYIP